MYKSVIKSVPELMPHPVVLIKPAVPGPVNTPPGSQFESDVGSAGWRSLMFSNVSSPLTTAVLRRVAHHSSSGAPGRKAYKVSTLRGDYSLQQASCGDITAHVSRDAQRSRDKSAVWQRGHLRFAVIVLCDRRNSPRLLLFTVDSRASSAAKLL